MVKIVSGPQHSTKKRKMKLKCLNNIGHRPAVFALFFCYNLQNMSYCYIQHLSQTHVYTNMPITQLTEKTIWQY